MRKLPNPPRRGHGGYPIPALFDCKPLRVTGMRPEGKPFLPKYGAIGSDIKIQHDGEVLTAQVWSLAQGGVWAVADSVAYLVGSQGYVAQVWGK